MSAPLIEVSLEGIPGPTHHFGGLAYGNLHAMTHAKTQSSPKRAALESLAKMSLLLKLGVKILLMPPHPRPNQDFLSEMGFRGSLRDQLQSAYDNAPTLFLASISSSFMWTANAASITAGYDSYDGKVHVTPANLMSQIHRAAETPYVMHFFETYIASENIVIHPPLPAPFADEGAANLIRLEDKEGRGHYLLAYGRSLVETLAQPKKFPARQTKEACEAIIRRHGLDPHRVQCVQQNPVAIDAGVFHQDVVAFGHQQTLVAHELAYASTLCSASPNKEKEFQGASPLGSPEGAKPLEPREGAEPLGSRWRLRLSVDQGSPVHAGSVLESQPCGEHAETTTNPQFNFVEIPENQVPLTDLIESYLCNGQLITSQENKRVFLAPARCQNIPTVSQWLSQNLTKFADEIHYIPVEESLKNGGGPACLRLRMPLTETEWAQIHPAIKLTPEKIQKLEHLVNALYPDTFHPTDILDGACLERCLRVTGELAAVLDVPTRGRA